MTRNQKVLAGAALVLVALGAFSAAGANAAHEFHCSVSPCKLTAKQDGTGATGHQVFVIENLAKTEALAYTCHEFGADAEISGNTSNEFTLTGIEYKICTINGSPGLTWHMNGCHYRFTGGTAGATDGAETHVECPGSNKIQLTLNGTGCTIEIGPQTLTGAGYHTIGTTPNREITVTVKNMGGVAVTAKGVCTINTNQPLVGTWTTGNFVMTGETTAGGVMTDAWFL
jgi:hypothetical protein